jgi:hypothetical protein
MNPGVSIRLATAGDMPALRRLADRDSRLLPGGDLLVAEEAGEMRAALSLATGESVADPFHPTAPLIELLRLRASQSSGGHPGRTRGRVGKLALRSAET